MTGEEPKPGVSPLRVSQRVYDTLKKSWHIFCVQCSECDPPRETPSFRQYTDDAILLGIQTQSVSESTM
jgi:hypothetical protein